VKLREAGRIVSMAEPVAVAVNTGGRRGIPGITVMPPEAGRFRAGFPALSPALACAACPG